MSIPTADNIIYNVSLYNDITDESIPAERYISRDQPFVEHIENYYVRLIGADISTLEIPLFIYNNDMQVTITHLSSSHTSTLVFNQLYTDTRNRVKFVEQFMQGLNASMYQCHVSCGAPGQSPLIVYDNQQLKFLIDRQYLPLQTTIEFNTKLNKKLYNFYTKFDSNTNRYQLLYNGFGNNLFNSYPGGIIYPIYVISQNVQGYGSLQEYNSMIVTCASIPVNRQLINGNTDGTRTFGILATIPVSFANMTSETVINYYQEYPVYNDILSRGILSEIDFKIYLVDQDNKISPLNLAPNTSASCKLEFVNKQIVKNYYPLTELR